MSALTAVPVYKKYTEENLLAAIKAVVDEGIKQTDASAKFGVPFTTLTRKIHLYQEYGGRLPRYSTKRKERPPRAVSRRWHFSPA